jgi:hypothetical protein
MMMALKANGIDTDEDTVNRVMGAQPMQGASWENAIACAQHYGMRVHLICPATLRQVKEFTDRGTPVMIAWNPEGREWSHASVIFDVEEDLTVHIADPNIPDPDETVRIVSKDDFYHKWFEKWPHYLVRRTAMAIEREITPEGRQMVASLSQPLQTRRDYGIDTEEEKKIAGYQGNPDGKDIYPVQIDHGYEQPISGGSDVMQQLQHRLRIEQGLAARVAAWYLMSEVEKPVIWLDNWRIFVNRPFVNKIRRNPDYLFMKLPRDGFIWIHPMTDIDPKYNGGGEYDFHFHPENSGWRSVTFNMHHRDLFLKEAGRLGATVVKKAFPQNMTHYVFGAENENK